MFRLLTYCLLLFALVTGCNKPDAPDCFQSSGEVVTENRLLGIPIDRIRLEDNVDLEIIWGQQLMAEVTGPENLIPEITTVMEEGVLVIRNDNSCNFVRSLSNKFKVTLFAQPNYIRYIGAGSITSPIALPANEFTLDIEDASGKIDMSFDADSLNCLIGSGVCDITLSGQTRVVSLYNQGLSPINASALDAEIALVNNNSLNDIFLRAEEYLFALIQSSGSVYVDGNPTVVSEILGSGELVINP